jgi:hypothetical protein
LQLATTGHFRKIKPEIILDMKSSSSTNLMQGAENDTISCREFCTACVNYKRSFSTAVFTREMHLCEQPRVMRYAAVYNSTAWQAASGGEIKRKT